MFDDMVLFVEVARARSFRGAAKTLNMPNSTISRRISALEQSLGLRLLNRTTRCMELTEAGQLYFERCERLVAEARHIHEHMDGLTTRPSGTLRASLPVELALIYLAPIISDFAAKYTELSFAFELTPRLVSLVSEPLDVAVRLGLPADSTAIVHKLGEIQNHLYASPEYLALHGAPGRPEELEGHSCLPIGATTHWKMSTAQQGVDVRIGGRFRLNNISMISRLTQLGNGIALLSDDMVADDVTKGLLQRVLPEWSGETFAVYALTETRLLPAKTQAFIDFLRESLQTTMR